MPRPPRIRTVLIYGLLSIVSLSFTIAVTTAYNTHAIVKILATFISSLLICRTVITMRRLNDSIGNY